MQLAANRSLQISRYFSAPPHKVWQAWTDPQIVRDWFGSDPDGKVLSASLDVRLDGRFEVTFRNSDETQYTCTGTYRDVVPFQKLVFTWSWEEQPAVVELVTVLFQAEHNGTIMLFEHSNIDSHTTHDYEIGWKSTFEKLEHALQERS